VPTKRIFDLMVISVLLMHPAIGLVRLESRRLARENDGALGSLGRALAVGL
jgi:hypothetical protein